MKVHSRAIIVKRTTKYKQQISKEKAGEILMQQDIHHDKIVYGVLGNELLLKIFKERTKEKSQSLKLPFINKF